MKCVTFNMASSNSNIDLNRFLDLKNMDKMLISKKFSLTAGDIRKLALDGGHFEIKYCFQIIYLCQ